jgi:VWFA-related protein
VTDRSGGLVKGLTAADFEVLEGGQPQPITKFELVENLPLTVGIALDTSGSMESSLVEAREAAAGFVKSVLKPGDRCFALRFDSRPDLLVPPTDDVEAVAEALDGLQAVGGTALHDALIASLHYFRATQGQRVLVLLSDGDDTASSAKFEDALEYARRSGVSIYTIGLNIPFSNVPVRNKLGNLAEATGGRTFYVGKATELASIYHEIEQEVRSRYLLAFQAAASDKSGYRPVEVKSRKSGLKVRAARGYYP